MAQGIKECRSGTVATEPVLFIGQRAYGRQPVRRDLGILTQRLPKAIEKLRDSFLLGSIGHELRETLQCDCCEIGCNTRNAERLSATLRRTPQHAFGRR